MDNHRSIFDHFTVIGISHWKASVAVREQFGFSNEKRVVFLQQASLLGYEDVVLLSTCNRSEVLVFCENHEKIRDLFIQQCEGTAEQLTEYGFMLHGREAAEHFMKVAVGLDSRIAGDLQIINQVKEAYNQSCRQKIAGKVLHRFIQCSFKAHKRTRSETGLASGAATTAYAAVQYARQCMGSLEEKKIVLVGTGKTGEITCKNLVSLGAGNITLVNRSKKRAECLGERYGLPVSGLEQLGELIAGADVIIIATSADSPVITSELFPAKLNGKPRLMIDLSVPRNIDPALAGHPCIRIVDMDMLQDRTDEASQRRRENIPLAEAIIHEELAVFQDWLDEQCVISAIKALDAKLEEIRCAEIERYINRPGIPVEEMADQLTRQITGKILALSISYLKNNMHDPEAVTRNIESIFKLKKIDTSGPVTRQIRVLQL